MFKHLNRPAEHPAEAEEVATVAARGREAVKQYCRRLQHGDRKADQAPINRLI